MMLQESSTAGLTVRQASVHYGAMAAVRAVDLRVRPGQVVGLVGTNGAGKSSLLRAVSGLVSLSSGSCMLDGQDISRVPAYKRALAGLAHVPEGRGLFPRLTVAENMRCGAPQASAATIRERFEQVYQIFPKLSDRRTQLAGSLSGGEQQMVAIARALMSEPKVMMFDEPALGLAPVMVDQVALTIRRLAQAGKAILLAEQHVDLAVRCADEIHVLVLGTLERSVTVDAADDEDHRLHLVELIMGGSPEQAPHV